MTYGTEIADPLFDKYFLQGSKSILSLMNQDSKKGMTIIVNKFFYYGFRRFPDNHKLPDVSVRDLRAELQKRVIYVAFSEIFH